MVVLLCAVTCHLQVGVPSPVGAFCTCLCACLIGGWAPVSKRCFTIPVRPRSSWPNEKISKNSSKRLVSFSLCRLVNFMGSRSNCSDTSNFVCLRIFFVEAGCSGLVPKHYLLKRYLAEVTNRSVLVEGH